MTKTLVKICGIRDINTAIKTARAGADFIGLVFHSESKRNVSIEIAKEIVQKLLPYKTQVVGVFVDQQAQEIEKICEYTKIRLIQLHGNNARKTVKDLPEQLTKIFALSIDYDTGEINCMNIEDVKNLKKEKDFLLFDGSNPGSGKMFNLDKFAPIKLFRFFLSGGLTSQNVCKVITSFHPFAVDVSSGVESEKGVKDLKLIKEFIKKVKEYEFLSIQFLRHRE